MVDTSTLIAPFYCHKALVELLSMYIIDTSEVLWNFAQTTEHEAHFDAHFASQVMKCWEHLASKIFIICFLFLRKLFITPTKDNHAAFLTFIVWIKTWTVLGLLTRKRLPTGSTRTTAHLLSRLNNSLAYEQLDQFYQVPVAIRS